MVYALILAGLMVAFGISVLPLLMRRPRVAAGYQGINDDSRRHRMSTGVVAGVLCGVLWSYLVIIVLGWWLLDLSDV
jgi:hypothetical protein